MGKNTVNQTLRKLLRMRLTKEKILGTWTAKDRIPRMCGIKASPNEVKEILEAIREEIGRDKTTEKYEKIAEEFSF